MPEETKPRDIRASCLCIARVMTTDGEPACFVAEVPVYEVHPDGGVQHLGDVSVKFNRAADAQPVLLAAVKEVMTAIKPALEKIKTAPASALDALKVVTPFRR